MTTIYHNPRCSKSRKGLEVLKQSGEEFEIREYLKEPLSEEELKTILSKLKLHPVELLRTEEKFWKENYKGKEISGQELIKIMVKNPKLIQRPIVVFDDNAVVGRPASKISGLIE